jgi:hypothetical protein
MWIIRCDTSHVLKVGVTPGDILVTSNPAAVGWTGEDARRSTNLSEPVQPVAESAGSNAAQVGTLRVFQFWPRLRLEERP